MVTTNEGGTQSDEEDLTFRQHDRILETVPMCPLTSANNKATSSHQKALVMYVLVKIRRDKKTTDILRKMDGTTTRGPTGNLMSELDEEVMVGA